MGLLLILFFGALVVIMLSMARADYPDYMYALLPPEEYAPIHEYFGNETDLVSVEREEPSVSEEKERSGSSNKKKVELPYFLSSSNTGHRIIEFYAPWCPHCRHFKGSYIKFAQDLDMLATRFGVHVDVYAVSCVPHRDICRAMGVHGYPTIKVYAAGSINGTDVSPTELHPFHVLETLGVQMDGLTAQERNEYSKTKRGQASEAMKAVSLRLARTKEEMFSDAFLSFDFALRQGIFMSSGPLEKKRKSAFLNWINMLHDTMPPTWKIHRQISAIRDNHEAAIQSEDELLKFVDPFRPEVREWSPTCTHGEQGMGYTCGLWELFHVMSIGVVEFNKMSNEWTTIAPMRAADKLRDFIEHFFGCEVCRVNFLAAYDACAHNRCTRLATEHGQLKDWKQLALWLWETHNAVNVRLMKERAERDGRATNEQDEINAHWPLRHECPTCWGKDGSWDEEHVFQYLKLEYWPDDGLNSATMRKRLAPNSLTSPPEPTPEDTVHRKVKEPQSDGFPAILGFLCVSAVAFLVYIFHEKNRLARSGRHKKVDEVGDLDP